MKKHLLFLFAALLPLLASAQTKVEIDGIWYNLTTETHTAEVTRGGNYSGSITIPATVTYDGVAYSVTSIGNYAFYDCSSLTSITIPEGVTSIGYAAFYDCSSLKSITIPKGVTSIGGSAFYGCSSLTAITLPEGVTSIGFNAFRGCTCLTAIVLPQSTRSVGREAFAGCPELTDIYCHAETVPGTNAYAFHGSNPEYATLHVPASALNTYKSTAPWSNFGKIVPLTDKEAGM